MSRSCLYLSSAAMRFLANWHSSRSFPCVAFQSRVCCSVYHRWTRQCCWMVRWWKTILSTWIHLNGRAAAVAVAADAEKTPSGPTRCWLDTLFSNSTIIQQSSHQHSSMRHRWPSTIPRSLNSTQVRPFPTPTIIITRTSTFVSLRLYNTGK